jgi:hypothetical protein
MALTNERRRAYPFSTLLLSASCLASCSREKLGLPSEIEWRSEHFVYHARAADGAVCPGVLDQMERHFDTIVAATGLAWPEGRVIHYYKFVDKSDYEAASGCPRDSSGCAGDGNAYAYEPFHEHELVHAYFEPLGSPPRILSEGVAKVLACSPLDFTSALPDLAAAEREGPVEIELYNPERDAPYTLGSLLVSHLIATYGWEAFLDLYRGPWRSRGEAELDQNLQDLYGTSFDSAWAIASRGAATSQCLAAWACAAAPLEPGVAQTPSLNCDDRPYRSVTGALQFDARGGGDAAFLLECPADPAQPAQRSAGAIGPGTFTDLGENSYVAFTSGDVTLTSRQLDSSMFGTECADLDSVELDPSRGGADWLFQPRTSPYFLRLDLASDTELTLLVQGLAGPVLVCPACELSDECVSSADAATFAVSSRVVLHFPAGSPGDELAELRMSWR